jgi:trigger factor
MKTELLEQEKNIVKIKVDFEAEEFTASLGEAIREITDKAKIPGFRKGRISRKVLEMRFGKGGLYAEAVEKMLPKAIEQVLNDYDLETIATPTLDLNMDDIREGQPMTCELTFEVKPEVSLPEFGDIEVERPPRTEVTDAMVDEMLAELRRRHSTLTPVDRAVSETDVVSAHCVSYAIDAEGNVTEQEPQDSDIDLGDSVRSEVREALLGKSEGERAEAEFAVESDHQDKELAGKKVRYDFTVTGVHERTLPEMAPEFYKKVTGTDIESEDAFREELKKRLLENLENDLQASVNTSAVEQVVSKSELYVPDTLVKRQMESLRARDASNIKRHFDLSMEEYFRRSSAGIAGYERDLREEAESIVRRTLVLDEVGKQFDVAVQKEEMEAEITRLAAVYSVTPAKMTAMFYKNKDRLLEMAEELRYDKIVQLIVGKVKIKDADADKDTDTDADKSPALSSAAEGAE